MGKVREHHERIEGGALKIVTPGDVLSAAGVLADDTVLSIGGTKVTTTEEAADILIKAPSGPISLEVERKVKSIVTPVVMAPLN